jgi:hypothetical protein
MPFTAERVWRAVHRGEHPVVDVVVPESASGG